MVARIHPSSGLLVVTFTRDDGEVEEHYCSNGTLAGHAIIDMVAHRLVMVHGDTFTVRKAVNDD